MRILMLGAGAVGGYLGGRMAATGSDLTFLVRKQRAAQLQNGLRIESPHGNATIPVKTMTADDAAAPFDAILLACKSFGLSGALDAITPYVGPGTHILPLLNGLAHLVRIEQRFPSAIVPGGTVGIATTMTDDGVIRQMTPIQAIVVGARAGQTDSTDFLETLLAEMTRAEIDGALSDNIEQSMWEKWTFLTTLAAATCLMNGTIGEILATDYGEALIAGIFDECNETAAAEGYPRRPSPMPDYQSLLFDRKSQLAASMRRDMNAGGPTEADHIIGDMIRRAKRHAIQTQWLNIAYSRLQVYEAARSS